MDKLLGKALNAKRESKLIEFKSAFDPNSAQDWCEIIKDIVALANTAGGAIVFGVDNSGLPCGFAPDTILMVDPAKISDKIHKYTSTNYSEMKLVCVEKLGSTLAVLLVSRVDIPLVFTSPGTYTLSGNKQKTAFSKGTVYFRHGAKSEPAHRDDLRMTVERNLENIRHSWLDGISKVTSAPPEYVVKILPPSVQDTTSQDSFPIYMTNDPSVPACYRLSPDETHPHRQKDVISLVNKTLPEDSKINQYHIRVIRAYYQIDDNELYCYRPKYSTNQYSKTFVEWLSTQIKDNPAFYDRAKQAYDSKNHVKGNNV